MTDQQPGPELNARVVEEVMGWTKHEHTVCRLIGADRHWTRPDGVRVERWHTQSNHGEDECWPFSTEIAAAWEVHRKMQERSLSVRQKYHHALQVAVQERLRMKYRPVWPGVFGMIEPVDICLAALEATKGQDDA